MTYPAFSVRRRRTSTILARSLNWQWVFTAAALCTSGCITTPVPRLVVANVPEGITHGTELRTPAGESSASRRPRVDDIRYAEQITLPGAPEIWIHRPESTLASLAHKIDLETSQRLDAPDLPPAGRRAALLERARARVILWRLEGALADLDAARRLQPGDVEVELERAWLLAALSRTGESAALMPSLFRLERTSSEAARVLGLIRFQEGHFEAATAALQFHVESPAASADLRLLHLVAEARATGKPLRTWVLDSLTTGPDVVWPGPVAGYMLGRIDGKTLLDAAAMAPVFPTAAAVCQAWFFVGQKELLRGDRVAAAKAFLAAVHTSATSAVEYRLATAELIHLGVFAANSLPGTPAW